MCPHPPLIVPELAGAAAAELDGLREACVAAITSLLASRPDVLVVVGGAPAAGSYDADAGGSLAAWGVDVRVGEGDPVLPLSLTIGRRLLDMAGGAAPSAYAAVASDAPAATCEQTGRELAGRGRRVALLVMADGCATLTVKSPGYLQPDAEAHNRALARALGAADVAALAALDPDEAERLWIGGRAAFQVLAGAARPGPRDEDGDRFVAELLYDDAPYGVGYFVARWRLPEPGPA